MILLIHHSPFTIHHSPFTIRTMKNLTLLAVAALLLLAACDSIDPGEADTLIVVASDHGHAAQIVPYPSMFAALASPGSLHSPGRFAIIETPEGGTMGVNYATSNGVFEEHTGTAIPVFGQGPGSERLG